MNKEEVINYLKETIKSIEREEPKIIDYMNIYVFKEEIHGFVVGSHFNSIKNRKGERK